MRNAVLIASACIFLGISAHAQMAPKTFAASQPKAPAGARVFIMSPQDGATLPTDFTVRFGARGIKVAAATDTAPGSGHHHLLIDVQQLPPMDAPIPKDAHHIHFGKGQTEARIHLSPGTHTLQLDFANFAHMQFAPPIVSKPVTVHVE